MLFGLLAALLASVFILWRNPVFFDHLGWTVFFVSVLPAVFGLLSSEVYCLAVCRGREEGPHTSPKETRILALLVAVFVSGSIVLWHVSRRATRAPLAHPPELLIVGLDGATWDIIDPMIEAGDLPVLADLCRAGVRGPLETLSPIWSPLIWTSIATGRNPEEHGITSYSMTRSDLKSARIWDIARDQGKRVGLFQWLITWPSERSFAFCIPSWLAHTPETWPPEYRFIQELNLNQTESGGSASLLYILCQGTLHGLRIETTVSLFSDWITSPSDTDGAFIDQHMRYVEPSTDVFLHLLRKYEPDVACFCLYGTDQLAHRFWKYFDPEPFEDVDEDERSRFGSVIPDYYRLADRALGRVLAAAPEATVIVVSDHGMGPDLAAPARYVFRMDRILQEAGLAGRFTITFAQRRYLLSPVSPLTVEELRSALATFKGIHLYESDDPIFQVDLNEDGTIILNPMMDMVVGPEVPLYTTRGIILNARLLKIEEAVEVRHLSGSHRAMGIVILKGQAIRRGGATEGATVLDIAPTALALLGLPVSREMPGRILKEAILEEFWQQHPVKTVDSFSPPPPVKEIEADKSDLIRRLRALGYVE